MSLRIISGRAGVGKTTFMQQEVIKELAACPVGSPIIFVVPDQMSYSTEHDLTHNEKLQGLIRAQVLTFKRLAWQVLQEVGGISRKEINGFGYRMMIRNVLAEHQDEFQMFQKAATKRGFTEEMEGLLKEFGRYSLDGSKLNELVTSLNAVDAPEVLKNKVNDITKLVNAMEEKLGTAYVDSEGYYPLLINALVHSEMIKEAELYIDGFTAFTTREFELVAQLMKVAKRVTIALPFESEYDASDEQALFYQPAKTAQHLIELALEAGITVEKAVHLEGSRRFVSKDLAYLEQNLERYPFEASSFYTDGGVEIIGATNPHAEIHSVARKVRQLVQDEQLRYREIAILYRDSTMYDPLISTIFSQYELPFFLSQKKPMLHHPLIELSRSILESIMHDWQYEPIFRAIKTDLLFPTGANLAVWRERADRLENYVIEHGIYSTRWFDEERWFYKKYRGLEFHSKNQTDEERAMQAEIEAVRHYVREPLYALQQRLEDAVTGRDYAIALYEFMEQLEVFDKLQALKVREDEKGELLASSEHEQAWNEWVNVLDQFVLMFGDQMMTLEEVYAIFDEGFDTLEFSRIPPSLDEITVATTDLARLTNVKVIFMIGMNEGVYPRRIDKEGVLADDEREWFAQLGAEIAPTSKVRLLEEKFITYSAMTLPSHKLVLSYPMADMEGKSVLPSTYIKRLTDLIQGLKPTITYLTPDEVLNKEDDWQYISHPRTALGYLMVQLRHKYQDNIQLTEEWQALYEYYQQDPYWQTVLERLMRPLVTHNEAETLAPEVTTALYGESLTTSISRLERFYRCPFSHFSTYGLQLQERAEYRLETPTIGDLFHGALKWISERTQEEGLQWGQLSFEQCMQLSKAAVEHIVPILYNQILLSNSRYRYIMRKLTKVVQRTMLSLSQHARVAGFKPVAIEASFGPGEPLPALVIPLNDGKEMKLRGRIDRIDAVEIEDKNYIRVIDYKSSAQKLDLNNVYHGLSLQMMTYLDVATENAKQWVPLHAEAGGVLYIHVHNPMLQADTPLTDEVTEQEILKDFKMQGLLLENAPVLEQMDEALEEGGRSQVVPVYMKKDNTISQSMSSVVEKNDMSLLKTFVRKKHEQAGNEILSGKTDIRPYRMKQKTACEYCSYKSVCQFDTTDSKQTYRSLHVEKAEEILQKIRQEVGQNDTNTNETN